MKEITNRELIEKAKSVIKVKRIASGKLAGDAACALVTDKNNVYLGACFDTREGMGFCAEHNAIGAMITGGEYKIKKIVTVGRNGKIIPSCGKCRELMYQINRENYDSDIIIGNKKVVKLRDLLPNPWQNAH